MAARESAIRKLAFMCVAVTAFSLLSLNIAYAQEGVEDEAVIDDNSPRFDVLINRPYGNEQKKIKPVEIWIRFDDGSTQKVDISDYGHVVVDVSGKRVHLHSFEQPPTSLQGPPAIPDTGPIRVPLPKNFVPGKGQVEELHAPQKKSVEKSFKDSGDQIRLRKPIDHRLKQLEAELRDLQQRMKSLRDEAKRSSTAY